MSEKLHLTNYMKDEDKKQFARDLQSLQSKIDSKMSIRGWGYFLEGKNIITKSQFSKVKDVINACRKKGFLPVNFTLQDTARKFDLLKLDVHLNSTDPQKFMKDRLNKLKKPEIFYDMSFGDTQDYYLEILVEKVDLVELFKPICKKYEVPIGNSRGWQSINQRYYIGKRLAKQKEKGKKVRLLYFGDFDPKGVQISEKLKDNLNELKDATGFTFKDKHIDRFGLNYDVIKEYDLTWINNLESSSGNVPDTELYNDWIEKYGKRKVEANALVAQPEAAKDIVESAILKYLGENPKKPYKKDLKQKKDKIKAIVDSIGLSEKVDKLKDKVSQVE